MVSKSQLAAEDAPPPYIGASAAAFTAVQSSTAGPSTVTSSTSAATPSSPGTPPPPGIARSNLLDIARTHNRVKGAYLIDPALAVPESLLAPLPDGADPAAPRPNLRLASCYAAVDADVWVVDSSPAPDRKGSEGQEEKTRLVFDSEYGSVDVRLHSLGNRPCEVEVHAGYGRVNIMLPRGFVGAVSTSTTYGSTVVPPQLTILSDAKGEGKYFMGDLGLVGADGWHGTTITVKATHGRIKFTCAEERDAAKLKKSGWTSWFSS